MDSCEPIHALNLQQEFSFDNVVRTIRTRHHDVVVVDERQRYLSQLVRLFLSQLVAMTLVVDPFEEPGADRSMNVDRAPDDLLSQGASNESHTSFAARAE